MNFIHLIIVLNTVFGIISSGKPDDLFKAILNAGHGADFQLTSPNSVICNPCKTSIFYKSASHYSNLVRHLTSECHKSKARWTVDESSDGVCKIISTVQKTNLLQFFGVKKKNQPESEIQISSSQISDRSTCSAHSVQSSSSTTSLPELIATDILNKGSMELSTQRKLQISKAEQLIKTISAEERIMFVSEGQQNYQLIQELTSSMETLEDRYCQKVEGMLSKLDYINYIPTLFLSNLCQFASQISFDFERLETRNHELLEITESFIIKQYQVLSKILYAENEIRNLCTEKEMLLHLKDTVWNEPKPSTDSLVKLSILMGKDNFLTTFLWDIIDNMKKRRPVWSETTMSLFSLLLNYGGPTTVELVRKNFGGPHLSSVYIKSRQSTEVSNIFHASVFANAANFYKAILPPYIEIKDVIFTLAIDATPVLPLVRAKGNTLIGFATRHKIEVRSANDIIQIFKDKDLELAQQSYAFILAPLRSDIPYFILAAPPVIKGESKVTVSRWMNDAVTWAKEYDIHILGVGADGDSKVRSYYLQMLSDKPAGLEFLTIDRVDFLFHLPLNHLSSYAECSFPDPRHLIKKWRNQILNVRRLLTFGKYLVQLEHIMEVADSEKYKHELGLWKTDIKVNDKQNVNAAIRLFNEKVQKCLKDYNEITFRGTILYLKLGTMLYQLYFDQNLHISERIRKAWTIVQYLRLWKLWTVSSGYRLDRNFISDQTYNDVLIAGHSLILFTHYHYTYKTDQPYEPWTWGSNSCEEVFSKARCFIRTKNNFCHAEFLDICRRLQKVSESERHPGLKTRKSCVNPKTKIFVPKQEDASRINNIIKEEMLNGDKLGCEMIAEAGMLNKLLSAKVLKVSKCGSIEINNIVSINANPNQNDLKETEKDELKILDNDDLLSLNENEIILTALSNDQQITHSSDLVDIACDEQTFEETETCTGTTEQNVMEPGAMTVDNLDFSLQTSSETSTCIEINPLQQNIVHHNHNDKRKNTHVLYNGRWYHINQFISWEQGKFYMPKQARLTRFFSNYVLFDKFMAAKSEDKAVTAVFPSTLIASWTQGKFVFGTVKRIVKLPLRGKSAFPIFKWEKSENQDHVDIAIQLLSPKENHEHGLSTCLVKSNDFQWISAKEYVTNLNGQWVEGVYQIEAACFSHLNEGKVVISLAC